MPLDDVTPKAAPRVATGVPGLDEILGGGLTRDRIYLVEGAPGSGKTTLALQFLLKGRELNESALYITLSETEIELRAAAASHGWSLDGIDLFELVGEEGLDPDSEQSVLHPSDVELGETTRGVMAQVERTRPLRVVFDSLSEMRLLAQNPLRHRRQILALKHFFSTRNCTVLLLDDQTSEDGDLQLHSIAHGVISLERTAQEYGSQRRRMEIVKMRGIKYRGGFHDFELDTGGVRIFERLVAAHHPAHFKEEVVSTGSPRLDQLMGGGLSRGTNTLICGPSGAGKTTTAVCCTLNALERGEQVAYYLFDEGLPTLLARSKALGMDLQPYLDNGQLTIRAIDPAELSPGEFAFLVRDAVERVGVSTVVIDSLNAYLQAMPGQKFLLLQMHELLTYLNQQGVVTLLILGQHGFVGEVRSDIDLSYLSDTILLFRFFEAAGSVRTAISAVKSRTTAHEKTIREIRLTSQGIEVGEALTDFQGVMTGLPAYTGKVEMLGADAPAANG
jgi:circadian clock protein KaiC